MEQKWKQPIRTAASLDWDADGEDVGSVGSGDAHDGGSSQPSITSKIS